MISLNKKKVLEYIIEETLIKVGSELTWLDWVAIDSENKAILGMGISKERNMFVAEHFLSSIVEKYGKKPVSTTDGGTWYPHQAFRFLNMKHRIHSSYEKSIIERTMQYIKDRTKECFDDYFPCRKKEEMQIKTCKELVESICRFS